MMIEYSDASNDWHVITLVPMYRRISESLPDCGAAIREVIRLSGENNATVIAVQNDVISFDELQGGL